MNATTVVFRTWPDGDVIALFPYEAADRRGAIYGCGSYMHVGQHSGADYDAVIAATRPSTPEEIAPLAAELRGIGYTLHPILRRSRAIASKSK